LPSTESTDTTQQFSRNRKAAEAAAGGFVASVARKQTSTQTQN